MKWSGKSGMSWDIRTIHPGVYQVEIEYDADENSVNNEMILQVDGLSLPFTTINTGGWYNYIQKEVGKVTLGAGIHSKVVLSPQTVINKK